MGGRRWVFGFHPKEPGGSVNSVTESEPCDLWWLWPMESVVPDGVPDGGGVGEWSWVVIEGEGEGGIVSREDVRCCMTLD